MRILIIEDDADISAGVEAGLRDAGFAVDAVADLASAEAAHEVNEYDAVVADRMVPDGDALDLVVRWRAGGDATPILFLTARDAVADRVDGFEAGGDDYLVKPFALDELVVRVRALCRRGGRDTPPVIEVGPLVIDRSRAEVRRDGVLLPLTAKERCLLSYLADNVDRVLTRSELIEHCWDEAHDPMSNVVDVHIASLRRKLGSPNPVRTVRGAGFVLDATGPT
ncbi:MAG: response regulator transcription factor [Actinomycetota bacterium]